ICSDRHRWRYAMAARVAAPGTPRRAFPTARLMIDDKLLGVNQRPEQPLRAVDGRLGLGQVRQAAVHLVGGRQPADCSKIGLPDDGWLVERQGASRIVLIASCGFFEFGDPLLKTRGPLIVAGFANLLEL